MLEQQFPPAQRTPIVDLVDHDDDPISLGEVLYRLLETCTEERRVYTEFTAGRRLAEFSPTQIRELVCNVIDFLDGTIASVFLDDIVERGP